MATTGPIIIFEDDKEEIEILQEVFRSLVVTNKILVFENGEEVLAYLRATPEQPFLIISDVNVHKMNGLELRAKIQGDEFLRRKSIPFIYLSTSAREEVVNKAYDLTVQGYFKKKTTLPEIEKQVRLIIEYWGDCKHPNQVGDF